MFPALWRAAALALAGFGALAIADGPRVVAGADLAEPAPGGRVSAVAGAFGRALHLDAVLVRRGLVGGAAAHRRGDDVRPADRRGADALRLLRAGDVVPVGAAGRIDRRRHVGDESRLSQHAAGVRAHDRDAGAVDAAGAWRLRQTSLQQDRDPAPARHRRLITYSAVFVLVFAVTFALGSVDWLMSLEPALEQHRLRGLRVRRPRRVRARGVDAHHVALRALGPLADVVKPAHLHDLGKLLLAFSTFWAYIWLSQYLLIWYGNLPDEVTYYVRRTDAPWTQLFLLNLFVNWVVPFLVLLPRAAKRSARVLAAVCVVLLAGHWLDLYLLIMPETWSGPMAGPLEAIIPLGYAGLFVYLTSRALAQAPLVPLHDPYLDESLSHET